MNEERNSQELESERLEKLYRKASDPVLRTHLLMVWRVSVGDSVGEVAESFVSTLKRELVHRHSWPSRQIARTAVFEYIEGFYNPSS